MKQWVKTWTPPNLVILLLKIRGLIRHQQIIVNSDLIIGYQASELVDVIIHKNQIYRDFLMINNTLELTSLRSVIGIGLAELDKSAHILDFGGGGGSHFYIARTAYPHYRFKWCVVETERMAKRANELVNEEDLYFVSSLENEKVKNESFDLVFCSSSLQYTSDPLGNLQKLVDLQIKYLFITRTVLSESEEVSIFQQISMLSANGPGPLPTGYRDRRVAYSLTSVPRSQFESIIHSKYKIVLSILEDEITFDVSKGTQKMYGYFCVLKT